MGLTARAPYAAHTRAMNPIAAGRAAPSLPITDMLTVLGTEWCRDCHRTRRFLDSRLIPYRYIDLAADPAAQRLLDDAGYRAVPVVLVPDGTVLVEPSDAELASALGVVDGAWR